MFLSCILMFVMCLTRRSLAPGALDLWQHHPFVTCDFNNIKNIEIHDKNIEKQPNRMKIEKKTFRFWLLCIIFRYLRFYTPNFLKRWEPGPLCLHFYKTRRWPALHVKMLQIHKKIIKKRTNWMKKSAKNFFRCSKSRFGFLLFRQNTKSKNDQKLESRFTASKKVFWRIFRSICSFFNVFVMYF